MAVASENDHHVVEEDACVAVTRHWSNTANLSLASLREGHVQTESIVIGHAKAQIILFSLELRHEIEAGISLRDKHASLHVGGCGRVKNDLFVRFLVIFETDLHFLLLVVIFLIQEIALHGVLVLSLRDWIDGLVNSGRRFSILQAATHQGRGIASVHRFGRGACRCRLVRLTEKADPSVLRNIIQLQIIELFGHLEDAAKDADIALIDDSRVA